MTSQFLNFNVVPALGLILLGLNFLLAPHNPYKEKKTPFECGYHSFLTQNRTQFTISFFIFGLLFLLFDLEIVLIYPYTMSSYNNSIYGLIVVIIFILNLSIGFIFELGKKALKIDTLQDKNILQENRTVIQSSTILLNITTYNVIGIVYKLTGIYYMFLGILSFINLAVSNILGFDFTTSLIDTIALLKCDNSGHSNISPSSGGNYPCEGSGGSNALTPDDSQLQIGSERVAYCEHDWTQCSGDPNQGTSCNFGIPHSVTTDCYYYCGRCLAIACEDCHVEYE